MNSNEPSRKTKNPLLVAAGPGFPYENFGENALLMPVTPATPAVLHDDAVPNAELDNFIGQNPPTIQQAEAAGETLTHQADNSALKELPAQPQKQGYFTSILSSLPNLSLSSITGDNSKQQVQEAPQSNPSNANSYGYSYTPVPHTGPPLSSVTPNLYDNREKVDSRGLTDVNLGPSVPPQQLPQQPPQQPPPAALPPSGGPVSYRLGNQKRLKYALPPNLTSNTPSQQYSSSAPAFPPQQNQATFPSSFLIPSTTSSTAHQQLDAQIPPGISGPPSGQGSSLQNSFRNSPVTTPPTVYTPPSSAASPQVPTAFNPRDVSTSNTSSLASPLNLNAPRSSAASPQVPTAFNPRDVSTSNASSLASPLNLNAPRSSAASPQAPPVFSSRDVSSSTTSSLSSPLNLNAPRSSTGSPQAAPPAFNPRDISTSNSSSLSSPLHLNAPRSSTASPHAAPPVFNPRDVSISNPSSLATAPQAIPCRFPETATPQNTPADFAFSGFSSFREQQAAPSTLIFSADTAKKIILPDNANAKIVTSGFDIVESAKSVDQTFSPISAAKVTEKLNHLIAEQQEEPSIEKAVDAATNEAVGTTTTAATQSANTQEKAPVDSSDYSREDELTDIDLNSSISELESRSKNLPPVKFSPDSTVRTKESFQPFSKESSFPVLTASSFFLDTSSSQKAVGDPLPSTKVSEFPNLYNPLSFPRQPIPNVSPPYQQQIPDISSSFQQVPSQYYPQQRSTVAETETSRAIFNAENQPTTSQPEPVKSALNSVPPSIWNPDKTSAVLNPVYGSSASTNLNFYNPSQFATANQTTYPLTTPSAYLSNASVADRSLINFADVSIPEPTGSATLNPIQMSVTPGVSGSTIETVPPSLQNLAAGMPDIQYRAVYQHWFYRKEVETKTLWIPFSMHDSLNLEKIHNSIEITPETKVATDGGRYDVNILRRERSSVYWSGESAEVRRCSWFYKGSTESRYVPYEESIAARLEDEFKKSCTSNNWNKRIDLNNGEYIMFLSPTVQVHYLQPSPSEVSSSWSNSSGSDDSANFQSVAGRPRVIKRGVDEFNIDDGEPERVDHLLFLVHGIGSVCDLKFRTVEEVVDEFRSISLQLVQSHYRTASEQGIVNRIEVLPISWHTTLHSEDTGIDKKLQAITLESIPKLRHFTNDTLLDILFYTSPIYCQTIMQTVGNEMNRLFSLFNDRNPDFRGNVYLGGHSLGSLILFDLLCHQKPPTEEKPEENGHIDVQNDTTNDKDNVGAIVPPVMKRKLSKKVSYVMGSAGTGQPYINYPQLSFHPRAFFALGSPIGMFVTVRGIDTLGEDFILPTCPAFFNIFHPFDPVAYRVESLINPEAQKYRPMLIPHHKGRKRMHLELKETMARVGADLKQKLLDSVRSTWNSVYQLAVFHKQDNKALELEIDKVVEEQMKAPPNPSEQHTNDDGGADLKIGKLNCGRRIDYVLQEAPFEYINDYLFALTSHVCYWESEDTMLLMLKEIYGSMGIQTDAQLPQQSLTFERISPSPSQPLWPSSASSPTVPVGVDPTAPISGKPVGPPPTFGFVRKS